MKFPYAMLLDYVSTKLSAVEVGDLFTMAGFELEGLEQVANEWVLDVKVPSNRGDGLSVFGLAREVLAKDPAAKATALYEQAVGRFTMPDEDEAGETGRLTSVEIETPECSRYACRVFRGATSGQSPEWMRQRLAVAGQRPISLLVDLTNYVMLELGQPLHAFDLDKLRGGRIVVRSARAGEKLTTLNGDEHELKTGQMMICDAERPVAAAGIMGGLETEVTDSTSNVLLESAHFVNTAVRRVRNQLGLNTEASYRFERSVDPEGVVAALNRFAMLLAEAGGPKAVTGVVDVYPSKPSPEPVELRMSRAVRLMGMDFTAEQAKRYLERLGMSVSGDGEPYTVVPPTWRPDIVREDDLVEEVGRVHGYERIPEHLVIGSTPQGGPQGAYLRIDKIREATLRCGFDQMMSHTMREEHPLDAPNVGRVVVRNPVSPETASLRSSLLPCLAEAARKNGGRDLHLFEIGRVFFHQGSRKEERNIAFLSTGALANGHWVKNEAPSADFFSLKGVLEEVLAAAHVEGVFGQSSDPRMHPTRQAVVTAGGETVGVIGQIHPDVAAACDLEPGVVLAELNLEVLPPADEKNKMKLVSRNPAVRRDIAILVSKQVVYSTIERVIAETGGAVLEKQWLFDVYEGKGIPEGSHSLAIALQLRKPAGNFTDEEANQVRDRVVQALVGLGATMR
jgi:phenylalanyl-tRNA synthetase beta chain